MQLFAALSWREFGWRLFGKLGVDFREKGAAVKMRRALQRNAYVTLLKINAMLLVRNGGSGPGGQRCWMVARMAVRESRLSECRS